MKVYNIPLRLPGINEYQNACRRHPLNGAQMKKNAMQAICTYLNPAKCENFPVQLEIFYTEPNKRRDIDNVTGFGNKAILDALQNAGIIPDDGPRFVNGITTTVRYESGEESILVHIKEPGDSDWKNMGDIDKTFAEAEKLAQEYGLYKKAEETPVKRKTRSKPKNNDKIKPTGALTFNF